MQVLVVSDFHLGDGLFDEEGRLNYLEDFEEDKRFIEFLEYHCSNKHYFTETTLVLNGDILNLVQMDYKGNFTHFITEEITINFLEKIYNGHKELFLALQKFLSRPNKKITYIIGNHDLPLVFEGAQKKLKEMIGPEIDIVRHYHENKLWIEHGHRFEPINTVPQSKEIVDGPNGQKIINLPWGSLFCIYVMPFFKEQRPHIDKIRPLGGYIRWTFFNDFSFFWYGLWQVFKYIVKTRFKPWTIFNKNFKTTLKILRTISSHPKYEKNAKKILSTRPDIDVVVMGHTHIAEWRKFKDGTLYFNTGTWNIVPSIDRAKHHSIDRLTYVQIDVDKKAKKVKNGFLNVWHGEWKPFKNEISASSR
jgi:UDP-2,3-diacylglucosamine pyrophosphatase LpxH